MVLLLESLGFTTNVAKSQLSPSQQIKFLGFQVDSKRMKLLLPEEKVQNIIHICQEALTQGRVSIRQLSQLLGKLNAASQAIPSASVRYRQLQQLKILSLRRSRSYRHTGDIRSGSNRGVVMVEGPTENLE